MRALHRVSCLTPQRLSICPYCGEPMSKKAKSIDHIIPKQIGGCNRFTIFSCSDCNSEISKIEQKAMETAEIRTLIAEMGESGFSIRTRRHRDIIPLQKSVGLAGHSVTKMYYNRKAHRRELVFLTPPDKFFLEKGSIYMLVPSSAEEDKVALVALASKIVLGTCAWLWGDEFSKTEQASIMRKRMRNMETVDILEMDSSERHVELSENPEKDALDNEPHHSILIAKLENIVVGLVNFFGSFESMTTVGNYDEKLRSWIGDNGVVVISKSTVNQVLKMTWEEYERFKSKTRGRMATE